MQTQIATPALHNALACMIQNYSKTHFNLFQEEEKQVRPAGDGGKKKEKREVWWW